MLLPACDRSRRHRAARSALRLRSPHGMTDSRVSEPLGRGRPRARRVRRRVPPELPPLRVCVSAHRGLIVGCDGESLLSRGPLLRSGLPMNASQKKVLQYLGEAEASEKALVRVLQSQIAMTPRGAYRTALDQHLRQTREHAERLAGRRRSSARAATRWPPRWAPSRASSARRWRSARRRSTSCAVPAARRRSSRTPRTPAPPRRWRSRPTRRSSASPAPSATTRRRSWPRRSAPTRRRCSSASCARSPS